MYAKVLHFLGLPGYAPKPAFISTCPECKRPIKSDTPGQKIHLGCEIDQVLREDAAKAKAAAKRERIDEIKQALRELKNERVSETKQILREYYGNNEGPK